MKMFDVIIIGAGAAGLMCAVEAGKRGRNVLLLDHAQKPAEKIRISGGGRCNFTNLGTSPVNFLSQNPHFCKSALSRYTQQDFVALVERHNIKWHEKTLGQLFCDDSAMQIINMLLEECAASGVTAQLETAVQTIEKTGSRFLLKTSRGDYEGAALVIATGGLSIPKMGATGFGYEVAKQFGLNVIPPRAGLVPLTFDVDLLAMTKGLSGLSVDPAMVQCGKTVFYEALLFTHKGLSGPSILQISSYWSGGDEIVLNLCPQHDVLAVLKAARQAQPRKILHNILGDYLPQRLAEMIATQSGCDQPMADLSDKKLQGIASAVNVWRVKPNGSEGYRTAEVTLGGVDTDELSSKTFEAKGVPGLYFIGEVVDVTGWLGGYNFQWAWSSGWCCGQAL
jgi:predicted Rossmann fold flavoprotein